MKQKYLLIVVISQLLSVASLNAQDLESTLVYANNQQEIGNYKNSALAYERVIFFSKGDVSASVYSSLADAYRALENGQRAIKFYDIAQFKSANDSVRNEIILKKVYTYLQEKNLDQALIALYDLNIMSAYFKDRKEYLKGLIYFLKEDYSKSMEVFDQYLSESDKETMEYAKLQKMLTKADKVKPNLAMWMSVVIPGSGQILYGNYKDGLNSLLLTAGFAALYVNYVGQFSIVEGYLVVLPWFVRYHRGGYQNAKENALIKQSLIRSEVYQSLVQTHPFLLNR